LDYEIDDTMDDNQDLLIKDKLRPNSPSKSTCPRSDDDEQTDENLSKIEWLRKLYHTYDGTYLNCMAVSYFFQGFKTFIDLSVMDLFK
jgi:hypothetical protein